MAWRGYTWCSLELSGVVADLKFRGIDIINSYKKPSVWPDILSLIGMVTFLRVACYVVAVVKASQKQKRRRKIFRRAAKDAAMDNSMIAQVTEVVASDDFPSLESRDLSAVDNSFESSSRSESETRTIEEPESEMENYCNMMEAPEKDSESEAIATVTDDGSTDCNGQLEF